MRTSDEYNPADDGNENSGKAPPSQAAECDIGLALNVQHTETTHPGENMNFMSSNTSLYHHPQHRASFDFGGGGGGQDSSGGGRLLFGSYSMANSNQTAYGTSFINTTGGDVQKMVFTASQLQEFENQTMIYKHIMSSNPIPPQLLLPLSTQYNRSDSEPWRCRRTDGKKWRCSRDVMPDQKYCERHAHKNRPRSRKPVETQNTKNHNTKENYHSIPPPATSMPTSCQQSRCTDQWFMRGGTIPLSSSHQKIQKAMASPSVGSKSDNFFQNLDGSYQDLVEGDCCSLSLMQPGGDYSTCADQDFFQMGTGMLSEDGSNPRDQVVHQGSWLGGPLGEALCPGVVSSLNQPTNVSSPNEYSSHELC